MRLWSRKLGHFFRTLVLSTILTRRRGPSTSKESNDPLGVLKELLEAGEVTPVIDRTYPLSEVPEAIRYLEERHAQGKVVITV